MREKKFKMGLAVVCILVLISILTVGVLAQENISFWHSMGGRNGGVIKVLMEKFNASHPSIKVEEAYQGNYYTLEQKLMAAIAAGNPPTICQIAVEGAGVYGPTGAVVELDSFIKADSEFDLEDIIPGLLLDCRYEGKLIGVPFNRSNPVLHYRPDMFRQAGLDPGIPPETWDELVEYARKLTLRRGDQVLTWGFVPILHWWLFSSLVWSNGGEFINTVTLEPMIDQPEAARGLQLWSDMVNKYGVAKINAGAMFSAWGKTIEELNQGLVAMYVGSIGDSGKITAEHGAAFVPRFKQNAVPNGGASLFMFETMSAEKRKAAWEFMKWFTLNDQTIYWSQNTGYMPVRTSAVNSVEMQEFYKDKPAYKVAVDQLKYARAIPSSKDFLKLIKYVESAMEECIISRVPAIDTLQEAAKKLRESQ